MTQESPEYISVTGARENNLRDVSLQIPKRAITAFVGVSGSGKSSLVFDTRSPPMLSASSTRRSRRSSAGSGRWRPPQSTGDRTDRRT